MEGVKTHPTCGPYNEGISLAYSVISCSSLVPAEGVLFPETWGVGVICVQLRVGGSCLYIWRKRTLGKPSRGVGGNNSACL